MGLISNILNAAGFYRLDQPEAVKLFSGAEPTKVTANERNMSQISAVYRAMNLISNTLAYLPVQVIKDNIGQGKEIIPNHPSAKLIGRAPNPITIPFRFKSAMMQLALRWGNSYAEIVRDGRNVPVALIMHHPSNVTMQKLPVQGVDALIYKVANRNSSIDSGDMIHIMGITLDGITGESPLKDMRLALETDLTRVTQGRKFYENGATLSTLLKVKKSLGNTMEQKRKAKELLLDDFREKAAGVQNAYGVAVVDEDSDIVKLGVPPKEAQFIESGQYSIGDVARFFSVNKAYLYEGEGKYNTLEHMNTEFYSNTMLPWLRQWEEELNAKLLKEDEKEAGITHKFDVRDMLRADVKTRGEWYQYMTNVRAITPNEIRKNEDMNPEPWGEEPLYNKNFVTPLDEVQNEGN